MAKPPQRDRPRLVPVSEEMARIFALLTQELIQWPEVTTRPMFGMRAFYRGSVIFAMLPDKRAPGNANAIAYKLADATKKKEGEKWQYLQLKSDRDTDHALARLDQAYRAAAPQTRKR